MWLSRRLATLHQRRISLSFVCSNLDLPLTIDLLNTNFYRLTRFLTQLEMETKTKLGQRDMNYNAKLMDETDHDEMDKQEKKDTRDGTTQ